VHLVFVRYAKGYAHYTFWNLKNSTREETAVCILVRLFAIYLELRNRKYFIDHTLRRKSYRNLYIYSEYFTNWHLPAFRFLLLDLHDYYWYYTKDKNILSFAKLNDYFTLFYAYFRFICLFIHFCDIYSAFVNFIPWRGFDIDIIRLYLEFTRMPELLIYGESFWLVSYPEIVGTQG